MKKAILLVCLLLSLNGCVKKEQLYDYYVCEYSDTININGFDIDYTTTYHIWVTEDHKSVNPSYMHSRAFFEENDESRTVIYELTKLGVYNPGEGTSAAGPLTLHSEYPVNVYGLQTTSNFDGWIDDRINADNWVCSIEEGVKYPAEFGLPGKGEASPKYTFSVKTSNLIRGFLL